MANQLGTTIWTIDTASPNAIYTHQVRIESVIFTDYNVDTDEFVITDMDGNPVLSGKGQPGLAQLWLELETWVKGLIIPTLTSGKLIISIK